MTSRRVDGWKDLWASYETSVSLDALLGVGGTVGVEHWLECDDSQDGRDGDSWGEGGIDGNEG